MTPKELLLNWVDAFNKADIETLTNFYEESAINHQVANEPLIGRDAIRDKFKQEFSQANMVCIIENIFEDKDWAILEWKDPGGLRGCGFFQVVDGKIRNQRGYWDMLSFLRQHRLPIPER